MKAENYPKARFCCMQCDELLPLGAETCPNCGSVVAEMNFSLRSNLRGAMLAGKAEWEKGAPLREKGKEEYKRAVELERRRKEDDRRVVSAVLVATDSKRGAVGAAGRAVVGGALLGPVGMVAGAASGTSKARKATFSVKYASGRTATETVEIGGKRFNELSKFLHE